MIPLIRVLLVDDHTVVRKGIRAVLSTDMMNLLVPSSEGGRKVLKVNSSEYTSKNRFSLLVNEIVIHLRLAVLLGGVFLLAACGPAATPAPGVATDELRATATSQAAASLQGTEWVLVSLQGSSPLAGTHIWLVFEDEQARGFAGCNHYGGPYTVTGMDALAFQEFDITEQACLEPEGVMEQETVYMAALRMAVAYRLAGDRLEIQDAAGETILAFER